MKKILSMFLILVSALLLMLTVYQVNQYMQISAAVGPSLSQLSQLSAADQAAAGISAGQVESTKALLASSTSSLLQSILLDFVLAVLFLLAGYFTYKEK